MEGTMLSSLAVLSPLDPKSVNAFVHAVLRRVIYKEPEEALPLDLILQLLDSLYEDPASQEAQQGKRDVFEAVAKVLALAGTEKWDVHELDTFLKDTLCAEEKTRTEFGKVFNRERNNITRALGNITQQTKQLKHVAWQVDVVAANKNATASQSTEDGETANQLATDPRVKLQLQTEDPSMMNGSQTCEMEIDGEHMQRLLQACDQIEASINSHQVSSKSHS